jgi:anti-anti-sigma regulatory factor/HAMP domain-containing protein
MMIDAAREVSTTPTVPFWQQIRWQLIISFVLLAVVPVILIDTISNTLSRSQAQAQAFNQLESIADLKRDQIANWINGSTTALSFLLSDPVRERLIAFANTPTPTGDQQSQIDGLLRQAIVPDDTAGKHAARFRSLFLYLPDGRIVAASDEGLLDRIVNRQPYFKPSLSANYVQPPYYAPGSNELVMIITHRLLNPQGQLVATLAGQLYLTILGDVMLSRSGLGASGETYLVSQESHYLLTPSRFPGYPLTRAYRSQGIDRALAGENGSGSYDNYRDPPTQVMGVYRWLPDMQAALLAETTTGEALAAADQSQWISTILMVVACLIALLIGLLVATRLSQPITALTRVAARITGGDLDQRANIRQRNEIGVLAAGFNTMTARLQQNLQGLELRVAERTADLQHAIDAQEETLRDLREAIGARQTLEKAIQELSSPVLPVLDGVLVMPLIGVIDSGRAALLVTALLSAIEQHGARIVLMDVTGVPLVDTQVARVLLQAADAARLLGAEPILVGIRPELAQTIVGLGLDLSGLRAQSDLQSGIRYASQRQVSQVAR